MTLLLTNDAMESLDIHPTEVVPVLEAAFRDVGERRAPAPARVRMYVPTPGDGPTFWVNDIVGAAPSSGTAAVRLDAVFSRYVETPQGKNRVRQGDFSGLVLLWDMGSAELLAILHDHYLSTRRVAATTAIGVHHLAREDAEVLALYGTGHQAEQHLLAMCDARPFREVRVYSRSEENRRDFVRRLGDTVDATVVAVDSSDACITGADVVVTATNARTPVFDGALLTAGMHLTTIVGSDKTTKGTEVDETAVLRADRIVTNLKEQIRVDEQPKTFPLLERGALAWDDIAELHDVVAGTAPGRQSEDEVTFHDNNTGMGLQFAAMGRLVYERALAAGIGVEVDGDLFMTRGGSYAP